MWIARNKGNGKLLVFSTKPVRCEHDKTWVSQLYDKKGNYRISYHTKIGEFTRGCFEHLTWEDEPVEVNMVVKNIPQPLR